MSGETYEEILEDDRLLQEMKMAAWKLEEMPEGLDIAKQLYFLDLRRIARDFRNDRIDRDQMTREAKKAERAYAEVSGQLSFGRSATRLWARIEPAAAAFKKEPTVENAMEMYREIYGITPRHTGFPNRKEDENHGTHKDDQAGA